MVKKYYNKPFFIFYFIVTYIFIGCNNSKIESINNDDENIISIDVTQGFYEGKITNLSDIASDIFYIKLETNPKCIISSINQLIVYDNEIFIYDKNLRNLLVFNTNGIFIRKIGSYGKGPKEYLSIRDFFIDKNSNIIYVFDVRQGRIIMYSLDGELEGGIPISFFSHAMNHLNNDIALFNPKPTHINSGYYSINLINRKGKIINKLLPQSNNAYEIHDTPSRFRLYQHQRILHLWENYSDTVYMILNNFNIIPKYKFIINKGRLPNNLYKKGPTISESWNHKMLTGLLETNNYLFIEGVTKNRIMILFNKNNQDVKNISLVDYKNKYFMGFYNDIDNGPHFWPDGVYSENQLYKSIDVWEFKRFYENRNISLDSLILLGKRQQIANLVSNIKIDDNPVIMIVNLK